jgi:Uma2 family endonuclease
MPAGGSRRLFTADEYHRLIEVGILGEGDRVELLAGEIWEAAAIGSSHAGCVNRLTAWFAARVHDRAIVAVQNPVLLDDLSEPEPDLTLLRPRADYYSAGHPTPTDVLLLVEVADSSWELDRGAKLRLYAAAGISEVWIVHLAEKEIHLFRKPAGDRFLESKVVVDERYASPAALPDLALAAGELFG